MCVLRSIHALRRIISISSLNSSRSWVANSVVAAQVNGCGGRSIRMVGGDDGCPPPPHPAGSASTGHLRLHPWFLQGRLMSTKGRSMRSKVEKRMRRETGKTLREIRRAKKLRKKLMTDEERLIYNLRRAKKKVALLLQKLKKYELPELPPPRHDPELLTPEQLQAYKKIGFRNRNYVPVGVRGVFGGVVQNMHLHWKFHETVQVCCDNFPKEKIKEMATMLARLSGGIVVNVHDVKTIIMFRGRNYRQPKNLIPFNTLTKRKALFKARFEQALDSQKLNIKKLEQQLRQMGVNPEDPIAMASVQRVASTFFRAIDEKQGTPYVFHGDRHDPSQADETEDELVVPSEDSDQEELDRFIAEIEDAADQEWAAEEAAEKEEVGRIRYWNEEDIGGRSRRTFPVRGGGSDDEGDGQRRDWRRAQGKRYGTDVHRRDRGNGNGEISGGDEWDPDDTNLLDHGDLNSDFDSEDDHDDLPKNPNRRERSNYSTSTNDRTYSRAIRSRTRQIVPDDMDTEDGSVRNDSGDNWESEDSENEFGDSRMDHIDYYSSSSGSDEE
ncbi:CRM-domain containing factor CFM9, mitochondrial [Nymphaea colorata]|nr:CRM-domain containing factor CFM9, mitochondrial [Nymphaea colorata]XP_031481349.1 CRM-domain containing factor CFM9, mitochondrial [Nymphaea colorata]XP_031481350.1 CRM-domain containing factor CFM9, mitochondrial [Nymphaea colorata]XP_049933042.1 CRM-domain containing factor CFM9, mitochondrial [Nymphaea colorata]